MLSLSVGRVLSKGLTIGLAGLLACGGDPETGSEVPVAAPLETETGVQTPAAVTPLLAEITVASGVDFIHRSGAGGDLRFPEMMGGGTAVLDADEDGDLDLYFVSGALQSGQGASGSGSPSTPVNRLFLQEAGGSYRDVTAGSGLGDPGYGTGVAVGDTDNDGHEDVFVANIGADRLFRGRGDATYEDVTAHAGIPATGTKADDWSTSAAFCDFDRDGYLDLYVVRYVAWDPAVDCTDKAGRREYCGPASFEDRVDVLLHNRGDGTFVDRTIEAGIDAATGAGLGVVCQDIDDDGWVDVYVANDGDPNQLWINQGDGTFVDDALIMGASANAQGLFEAGMGVVAADFDNDLDFDLFVTHLRDETNTFYRNLGAGMGFEDETTRVGLAAASTPFTGFGTAPFDIDLDGDLDLVIANGRVTRGRPLTDALPEPWRYYAEPNLVFLSDDGVFRLLGDEARAFTGAIEVSRGLATGDLDADGDLDVVVTSIEGPARIYRVDTSGHHWLLVDAVDPRLGRRAIGARVVVSSPERRQIRTVQGAMSYLSSSDPRAHFGLGSAGTPVSVWIRWPDGLEETFDAVAVDQAITLRRGEGGG